LAQAAVCQCRCASDAGGCRGSWLKPLGIQQQFGDAIARGFAKVYMQRTQIAATNPDTLMAKAALALFKPGSGLDNRENALLHFNEQQGMSTEWTRSAGSNHAHSQGG
jgi:hypothetical protein